MAKKWIAFDGERPSGLGKSKVDIKYRDGMVVEDITATAVAFSKPIKSPADIVAYRLSEAPKRPRTKAGKPKVETPKRKRVRKPVEQIDYAKHIKDLIEESKVQSAKIVSNFTADPYEAYRREADAMANARRLASSIADSMRETKERLAADLGYPQYDPAPDKRLADSVILVALGIVSGAIATAACFLIFA